MQCAYFDIVALLKGFEFEKKDYRYKLSSLMRGTLRGTVFLISIMADCIRRITYFADVIFGIYHHYWFAKGISPLYTYYVLKVTRILWLKTWPKYDNDRIDTDSLKMTPSTYTLKAAEPSRVFIFVTFSPPIVYYSIFCKFVYTFMLYVESKPYATPNSA